MLCMRRTRLSFFANRYYARERNRPVPTGFFWQCHWRGEEEGASRKDTTAELLSLVQHYRRDVWYEKHRLSTPNLLEMWAFCHQTANSMGGNEGMRAAVMRMFIPVKILYGTYNVWVANRYHCRHYCIHHVTVWHGKERIVSRTRGISKGTCNRAARARGACPVIPFRFNIAMGFYHNKMNASPE